MLISHISSVQRVTSKSAFCEEEFQNCALRKTSKMEGTVRKEREHGFTNRGCTCAPSTTALAKSNGDHICRSKNDVLLALLISTESSVCLLALVFEMFSIFPFRARLLLPDHNNVSKCP